MTRSSSDMHVLQCIVQTIPKDSDGGKTKEHQRICFRLRYGRHGAGQREGGVVRSPVRDISADAKPVGVKGCVANPSLQVRYKWRARGDNQLRRREPKKLASRHLDLWTPAALFAAMAAMQGNHRRSANFQNPDFATDNWYVRKG